MAPDELAAWLALAHTPGLGRGAARQLLARDGDPVRAAARGRLAAPSGGVQVVLDWLGGGSARRLLVLGDPAYPEALLETADPPLLLYALGDPRWLRHPALAIVGSRHPTPQGLENARAFAAALAGTGHVIVSGLALGIDAAAHEGALDAGGATIAVVGTGVDRVYPARHRELAHRIATQGLILGEFALGAPALREHFPQRNRILAGLARGTLVVEAALRSGSLVTARCAADAGREVYAIPGSIHAPQSKGCHALIKQGAKLVECVGDVLTELPRAEVAAAAPAAPAPADALLEALGWEPVDIDTLAARSGASPAALHARLLELELEGLVAALPGGRFQRHGRG